METMWAEPEALTWVSFGFGMSSGPWSAEREVLDDEKSRMEDVKRLPGPRRWRGTARDASRGDARESRRGDEDDRIGSTLNYSAPGHTVLVVNPFHPLDARHFPSMIQPDTTPGSDASFSLDLPWGYI
jgi:hypothetical protein